MKLNKEKQFLFITSIISMLFIILINIRFNMVFTKSNNYILFLSNHVLRSKLLVLYTIPVFLTILSLGLYLITINYCNNKYAGIISAYIVPLLSMLTYIKVLNNNTLYKLTSAIIYFIIAEIILYAAGVIFTSYSSVKGADVLEVEDKQKKIKIISYSLIVLSIICILISMYLIR